MKRAAGQCSGRLVFDYGAKLALMRAHESGR